MTDTSSSDGFDLDDLPDPELPDRQEALQTIRTARFGDDPECVDCSSREITELSGTTSKGAQKYQCESCGGYFNTLSDSIFAHRKLDVEELVFLVRNYGEDSALLAALLDRDAASIAQFTQEVPNADLSFRKIFDYSLDSWNQEYRSTHDLSVDCSDEKEPNRPYRNGYILTDRNLNYLLPDSDSDARTTHMKEQIHEKSDNVPERLRYLLEDLTILSTHTDLRLTFDEYARIQRIMEPAKPEEEILLHPEFELQNKRVAAMGQLGYAFRQASDLEENQKKTVDLLYGFMVGLLGMGSNSPPLHPPGDVLFELAGRWRSRYSNSKDVLRPSTFENPAEKYANARSALNEANLKPTAPLIAFLLYFNEFDDTMSDTDMQQRVVALQRNTHIDDAAELADEADKLISKYSEKRFPEGIQVSDIFETLFAKLNADNEGQYLPKQALADTLGTSKHSSTRTVNTIANDDKIPQAITVKENRGFKLTAFGQFVAHHWLHHHTTQDWIHRAVLAAEYDHIGADSIALADLDAFKLAYLTAPPDQLNSPVLSFLHQLVSSEVDQPVENRLSADTGDLDREIFWKALNNW